MKKINIDRCRYTVTYALPNQVLLVVGKQSAGNKGASGAFYSYAFPAGMKSLSITRSECTVQLRAMRQSARA